MKTYKHWLIASISIVFATFPIQIFQSTCGGYSDSWLYYYNFLEPTALIPNKAYQPFHFTFDRLYDYEWNSYEAKTADNIKEWQQYANQQASEEDIIAYLYKANKEDAQKIVDYIQGKNRSLGNQWGNNSFVKYIVEKKDAETAEYILFAKNCEPHLYWEYDWIYDAPPQQDFGVMETLLTQGIATQQKTKNANLKLRYAYQIVRLAFQLTQYEKAIQYYDQMIAPLNSSSTIKYWALNYKAGALQRIGKQGESAYYFSIVFDKCPNKRVSAYYSFKIEEEKEWQQALALCQNSREKTTLYLLRGIKPEANALEEMKNIYALDPSSDQIALLLIREINKLEYALLDTELNENLLFIENPQEISTKEAYLSLQTLQSWITQVAKEQKTQQPALWQIASFYLQFLEGKRNESLQGLKTLAETTNDPALKKQAKDLILVFQITLSTQNSQENYAQTLETTLFEEVNQNQSPSIQQYYARAMERFYALKGLHLRSMMCQGGLYTLRSQYNNQLIEEALQLIDKPSKTPYEQQLCLRLNGVYEKNKTLTTELNTQAKHNLLEIKATLHLANRQWGEAIKLLQALPGGFLDIEVSDPFQVMNLNDCIRCEYTGTKYNKLQYAKKMLELEQKANASNNSEEQLKIHQQIANAYYNTSHYGHAWEILDYERGGSDIYLHEYYTKHETGYAFINYFDNQWAYLYYQKAANIAKNLKNKELAAELTFMAAKCEQNNFWFSILFDINEENSAKQPHENFEILQKQYKDTRYYAELLEECTYFHNFVNQ
ncbi:MAG: hypothetical protein EAZ55_02380 [Cytophagales bacterium]|nr:MAG: hypothetical protein EAZ55_02380 [Cytophagales bacterium]